LVAFALAPLFEIAEDLGKFAAAKPVFRWHVVRVLRSKLSDPVAVQKFVFTVSTLRLRRAAHFALFFALPRLVPNLLRGLLLAHAIQL
jgi:hypothetical protein